MVAITSGTIILDEKDPSMYKCLSPASINKANTILRINNETGKITFHKVKDMSSFKKSVDRILDK